MDAKEGATTLRLPRLGDPGHLFCMVEASKLESCRERFAQDVNIVGAWVLGSAVTNRLREDSDVDFAILYAEEVGSDYKQLGGLSSDLESILGRRVDVGRLNTRNLIFAHEAISHGVRIYCKNQSVADSFMERVYALYFDLKRDRKVVEDAYCA